MTRNALPDLQQDLPDELIEEAVRWYVRLREPTVTAKQKARFQRWMAADPRHALAFAEARLLWDVSGQPAVDAARQGHFSSTSTSATRRRMPGRRTAGMALAACLMLAVLGGNAWRSGLIATLRSDYVTAVGAQRHVTLADGTQVSLNTDTAMAVGFEPEQRSVHLFRGEAWFDVTHDEHRPFTVITPDGSVRVVGTRFNVRLADGRAVVSLEEGRVELRSPADRDGVTVLKPGEQSILTERGAEAPVPFDAAVVKAWQHGQFVFYQTPLSEVVGQLNRYYQGRIMVVRPSLATLRVTGVFDAIHPAAALQVIENTLHIKAFHLTGYLILLH